MTETQCLSVEPALEPRVAEVIGQIDVLKYEPGDMFVFSTKTPYKPREIAAIREQWQAFWKSDPPKLIILTGDMKLTVMREHQDG